MVGVFPLHAYFRHFSVMGYLRVAATLSRAAAPARRPWSRLVPNAVLSPPLLPPSSRCAPLASRPAWSASASSSTHGSALLCRLRWWSPPPWSGPAIGFGTAPLSPPPSAPACHGLASLPKRLFFSRYRVSLTGQRGLASLTSRWDPSSVRHRPLAAATAWMSSSSTERPPSGRGATSRSPAAASASGSSTAATTSAPRGASAGGGVAALPPRRPEPPATIPLAALEILPNGAVSARHVQKADVAAELSLNLRDLRVVDPTFRNESPVILARPTAMVIHLLHVRILVTASRVLLFDPHHPAVAALTPRLRARLIDAAHPLPFEMRALEAVLVDVCCGIRAEVARLKPKVQAALDVMSKDGEFGGRGVTEGLDQLLPLEMGLNELTGSVGMVRTALNEVLMSDEDMSDMYLSWKSATGEERGVDEHDEIEMMVEGYLKQVDAVAYELGRLLRAVKTTENVTQIRLDASRNRILRLEVFLNLGAVSVASAACFAGLFGMNLLSGWEEDPYAFWMVSVMSVGVAAIVFRSVIVWLRWKRIFS